MKEVDIHFANGSEVLNAYWGHLNGGGLRLRPDRQPLDLQELCEGQPVSLRLHVASQHQREVALRGTVISRRPDQAVIAFDCRDSQDRLLTAALFDREIDADARVSATTADAAHSIQVDGHVFELGEEGCRFQLSATADESALPIGDEVTIDMGDLCVTGCIIAAHDRYRWIFFGPESSATAHAYLSAMRRASGKFDDSSTQ